MDWKLKVIQGKNAGQEVEIPGKRFLIGRAEDCNLRPGSDMISRHHCAIIIDQDYVAVRDFGSKNGTLVNGSRVVGESEIKPGDRLKVGPLEFELMLATHGELGGKKRPPVHDAKEAAARTAESRQEDDPDVSKWLADLPTQSSPTGDTQSLRLSDTDAIDIGVTRTVVPEPAAPTPTPVPAPASAPAAAVKKPLPTAKAPSTYVPPPETPPVAEEPSTDKSKSDSKKGFGKLPQNLHGTKDSREAAADMLSKFRKRR